MIKDLHEYHETIEYRDKKYTIISYIKILDYKLFKGGSIIDEVSIEKVFEVEKYLKGEPYLSTKETFTNDCPSGIKSIVNVIHQLKGGNPLTV